ncbi:MAG: FHA domain-containing protein [Gemmatimonadaceae bacterium]
MPPTPSAPAIPVVPVELRAVELEEAANDDRARVLRMHVAGDRRDAGLRDERSAVTLRLERPQDGTLQFLPGRLEIIEGRDVGQEVKFVRTAGPDGTTITFGRAEGAQYRHVQLHEPTVSRMHAKLALDGKSWSLINLSATNPVIVNGMPLAGEGSTVVLREGDRIEMGEVVFRFRAK